MSRTLEIPELFFVGIKPRYDFLMITSQNCPKRRQESEHWVDSLQMDVSTPSSPFLGPWVTWHLKDGSLLTLLSRPLLCNLLIVFSSSLAMVFGMSFLTSWLLI